MKYSSRARGARMISSYSITLFSWVISAWSYILIRFPIALLYHLRGDWAIRDSPFRLLVLLGDGFLYFHRPWARWFLSFLLEGWLLLRCYFFPAGVDAYMRRMRRMSGAVTMTLSEKKSIPRIHPACSWILRFDHLFLIVHMTYPSTRTP